MKHLISKSVAALSVLAVAPYSVGLDNPTLPTKAQAATYKFSAGDGSVGNPYIIKTPQDLRAIENDLNASYKLANDINLAGINWQPIGQDSRGDNTPFQGILDGNGHSIKGLTFNTYSSLRKNTSGLFGSLGKATVKDLQFKSTNITVSGSESLMHGVLAGFVNSFDKPIVQNVVVDGVTIENEGTFKILDFGGLIGAAQSGTYKNIIIKNIKMPKDVGSSVGGLFYSAENVELKNIDISNIILYGEMSVGGLAGILDLDGNSSKLENIVIKGTLSTTGNNNSIGSVMGSGEAPKMKNVFCYPDILKDVTSKYTAIGGIGGSFDTGVNKVSNVFLFNSNVLNTASINNGVISGDSNYLYNLSNVYINNYMSSVKWSRDQSQYIEGVLDTNTQKSKAFYKNLGLNFDNEWGIKDGVTTPYLIFADKFASSGTFGNLSPAVTKAISEQNLKISDGPVTLNLNQYFSDPEGSSLTYEVKNITNDSIVSASNFGSDLEITPYNQGETFITVAATDSSGLQVEQTFKVIVTDPPAKPANFVANALDYNQVSLSWDYVPGAYKYILKRDGVEIRYPSSEYYIDSDLKEKTTYKYEVIAVTWNGNSEPASVTVTTPKMNHAPEASVIPNQTLKVTDNPLTIDVAQYFSDADGDALTYSIKDVSNGNVTATTNGSKVTIKPNKVGTSEITLMAKDPGGLSVEQTFIVTVKDIAPITPTNFVAKATAYNETQLSFTAVANAKEYIIKRNGSVITRITGTSYVDKNLSEKSTYKYEVIAVNDEGESQPAAATVTTPGMNHAPEASTIPNQTLKVTDNPLTIDVSQYFSDPDGDSLTYSIKTISNGNVSASISSKDLKITPNKVGTSDITLIAKDAGGLSVEQKFTVTVKDVAPVAPTNLVVTATAYNEVQLSFDSVAKAKEYIIRRDGKEITRTTDTSYTDSNLTEKTSYRYEVIAVNDAGESQPATATVTTPNMNHAPVASTIPNQTIKVTDSPLTIDLGQFFKDPDEDDLTYSVKEVSNNNVSVSVNGDKVKVTPSKVGSSDIILIAKDAEGLSVEQKFTVTVKDVAPSSPANLVANATAYNEVQLSFDSVDKANEYIIKRDGKEIARTTSTSYTDGNLTEKTSYKYEVIAVNDAGESQPVATTVTTPEAEAPVTAILHVDIVDTTANLTWDSIKDASNYRVQRYIQQEDGTFVKDGAATATSDTAFSYAGLQEGKTYKFEVTPRIDFVYDNERAITATVTIAIKDKPDNEGNGGNDVLQNVHVVMKGKTADITWDPSIINQTEITAYRIVRYVKDEATGEYKPDGLSRAVTGTSYTDTYKLIVGKTYRYEITPKFDNRYATEYTVSISDIVNSN